MAGGSLRGFLAVILLTVGCSANVLDTDLLASNSFMLAPSTARTVFLQNRNSSDNQDVTLHDLGLRRCPKGYQVVQDPQAAAYVVLTNIVYCNQTKIELPVEDMVAGGYESGIGSSIMSGLHGLTGMAGSDLKPRRGGRRPRKSEAAADVGVIVEPAVVPVSATPVEVSAAAPAADSAVPAAAPKKPRSAPVRQRKPKDDAAG